MSLDEYGFHFEPVGKGSSEGPIDPAQQHFEGSTAAQSVVRETGQNSLDAAAGGGPVRMEFELASMATEDIPGIKRLRRHLESVVLETRGQAGHADMVKAAKVAGETEVSVLRISDYVTVGLGGSEAMDDFKSPLSKLTRGSGISEDDGDRGGSFGIGSAVGPMASDMATVLYTSLPTGMQETVLAGYSRLSGHRNEDGVMLGAKGFLTHLGEEDFKYLRPAPPVGPFNLRSEPGTDLYILGFRMAEDDPELMALRDAAIDNFMVAIDRGRLEVKGISPHSSWQLDKDSIEGFAKARQESHAFYRALQDPEPEVTESARLGRVSLHIYIDDTLDKKLHTITMRKPLMRIGSFRHTSIPAKYAAVLICDDDSGNKLLRELEPPQHHKWDGGRHPDGPTVLRELRGFVLHALRERVRRELGDTVEIKGLERFLPAQGVTAASNGTPAIPQPGAPGSDAESSTVTGSSDPSEIRLRSRKVVPVRVRRPAIGGVGDDEIEKGPDRGGNSRREGDGVGLPGVGSEGEGRSRIRVGDVRFRSWSTQSAGSDHDVIILALTPASHISGDLELMPLGPSGDPERNYVLPISSVHLKTPDGMEALEHSRNVVMDLDLPGKVTTLVELTVPSGRRYRIGVA